MLWIGRSFYRWLAEQNETEAARLIFPPHSHFISLCLTARGAGPHKMSKMKVQAALV
jgi:hypothetical protein